MEDGGQSSNTPNEPPRMDQARQEARCSMVLAVWLCPTSRSPRWMAPQGLVGRLDSLAGWYRRVTTTSGTTTGLDWQMIRWMSRCATVLCWQQWRRQ